MHKVSLICLAFLFLSKAAIAGCCLIPCSSFTSAQKQEYESRIKEEYRILLANLDELKESYNKQKRALLLQNKELESRLAILKEAAAQDSEIIFLLKQYNQLQSNENSQRSLR